MGAEGDLPRRVKLPHLPNKPTSNPLPIIGRLKAAKPLYTFSIRLPPPITSAGIILCFQRLAEVGGSNFGLPPPFTSANYLRRIYSLFSTLGGSRRK